MEKEALEGLPKVTAEEVIAEAQAHCQETQDDDLLGGQD